MSLEQQAEHHQPSPTAPPQKRMGPRKKKRDYVYHIETRNISFLETSRDLRILGIKNNAFFLRLYDETLRFVDPFDPMLTAEVIQKIIFECIRNPWYFLRECVRIPEQGGTGMPYILHRANLAATFCFLNGIDHYLVIPRQKGKTQSTVAALNWSFLFGTNNSEFMFINKTQDDANNNLDRIKQQRDALPSYMHFKEIVNSEGKIDKETNNVKSMMNPVTKNKIVTKPMATSKERADNIGRGSTQPIQYYDEVEFTPFIKTIVEAAGPAFNTARKNAKRNKAAYCRIFTSTPGDLDSQSGQDALKIVEGTCTWSEQFYDWSKEKIEDYVKKNSINQIMYIEYNYKQLGDDEEWLQAISQSLLNNAAKIKREVFLKRMRGSSESPFEPEELEALQQYVGIVREEIFINAFYKLDIYEKLDRTIPYIVGMDCAQGLGADNTTLTIINPYTLKPVADFKSPYISIPDAANLLTTVVTKHIPRAILCVERNNVGIAIIELLLQSRVRNNVYYDSSKDKQIDEQLDTHGFLVHQAQKRKLYGVWTGTESRKTMFTILEERVKMNKDEFISKNVINDILTLVRKKNGKIEHGSGFHDDSLMSYLIALYVYYHGKNLHRFGFIKGRDPNAPLNEGLAVEEAIQALPEQSQQYFSHFAKEIDASEMYRRAQEEYQRARAEADQMDQYLKPTNHVENEFREDNGSVALPDNFFDLLND